MIDPNPKVASLPVLVLAITAVQVGAAFLAISVQQSTGARLDAFLDGLVVLTVFWAIVVLVDMFVFPTQSKTHVIVGPAFLVTIGFAILSVIFRSVEGVMGHSLGVRHAFGRSGYLSTLVWAAASLWGLLTEWFRTKQSLPASSQLTEWFRTKQSMPGDTANCPQDVALSPESSQLNATDESEPERAPEPAPAPEPKPAATSRSAFSAALETNEPPAN